MATIFYSMFVFVHRVPIGQFWHHWHAAGYKT